MSQEELQRKPQFAAHFISPEGRRGAIMMLKFDSVEEATAPEIMRVLGPFGWTGAEDLEVMIEGANAYYRFMQMFEEGKLHGLYHEVGRGSSLDEEGGVNEPRL